MNTKSNLLKSIFISLILLVGTTSAWGTTQTYVAGEYIYIKNFVPSGWGSTTWILSNSYAWAHMWGGTAGEHDYLFELYSGTAGTSGAIYRAKVTAGGTYTNVIFTRNSSNKGPWTDKWNQTENIVLDGSSNCFTSFTADGTSKTCSKYADAPTAATLTLAGAISGDGTQANPYTVYVGENYTLTASGTFPDPGNTKQYAFNNTTYSTTNTKTVSFALGTTSYYANVRAAESTTYSTAKKVTIYLNVIEPTYSYTVTAGAGGSVTPTSGTVAQGSGVTIEATPDDGYEFDKWTATNGTLANANNASTTFTPTANNANATASFKLAGCTQTPTTPTSLTAKVGGNALEGEVCSGTNVTLTAGGTISVGSLQWGTGTVGKNIITEGNGRSSITVSPAATTTYWVRSIITEAGVCEGVTSDAKTLQVSITPALVQPVLSKSTLTLEDGGSTGSITVTSGTTGGTWTSSDTNVATVNNGTVTSVGPGTATITYTVSNACEADKTATCTVTVNAKPYYIAGRLQQNWNTSSTTQQFTYVSNGQYKYETGKTVAELSAQWQDNSYKAYQYFFIHTGSGLSNSFTSSSSNGHNFHQKLGYANALTLSSNSEDKEAKYIKFANTNDNSSDVVIWWEPSTKELWYTATPAYTVTYSRTPEAAADAPSTNPSVTSGEKVLSGTSVTFTAQDAKTGYAWKGWYDNSEGTGTALSTNKAYERTIDGNTTIYAVYTEILSTITIIVSEGGSVKVDGEDFVSGNTVQVGVATTKQVTAVPYEGYGVEAWGVSNKDIVNISGANTVTLKSDGSGSTGTLYANFIGLEYTITFDRQSGSDGTDNVTVRYKNNNYSVSPVVVPTRAGYTFGGYYSEEKDAGVQVVSAEGQWLANATDYTDADKKWLVKENTTLYAQWTANTYTVTFDGNGATEGSTSDQDFTYDQAQNLNANGFRYGSNVFLGWSKEAKGTVEYTDQQSVSNLTTENNGKVVLYAIWATPKTIYLKTVEGTEDGVKWYVKYNSTETLMDPLGCTGEFYTAVVPEQTEFQFVSKDNSGNVVETKGGNILPNDEKNLFNLVTTAASGDKIYFQPNSSWKNYASTHYFVARFEGNSSSAWKDLTDPDGDGIYECEKSAGATTVYFCLTKQQASTGNWGNNWPDGNNKPAQTSDNCKTIPDGKNLLTINNDQEVGGNNDEGTWSTHADTPVNGEGAWEVFEGITYRITFNQTGATNGETTPGTAYVDAQYGAAMPAIESLPTNTDWKFGGYYTQAGGQGTKITNAFGDWLNVNDYITDGKWAKEECVTLYAHWVEKTPEITVVTLDKEAFDAGTAETVTATPSVEKYSYEGTFTICWKMLDNAGTVMELFPFTPGDNNSVTFSTDGLTTGKYTVRASIYASTCGEGEELSRYDKTFTIVSGYKVTVKYLCGEEVIQAPIIVEGHASNATEITAPEIGGYKFVEWVLGDGISSTSTLTNPTISYTAIYDGYLTAKYEKRKLIFLDLSTLPNKDAWTAPHIYLYKEGGYWNDASGAGSKSGGNFITYAAMEKVPNTEDIWYYDYENVANFGNVVAFTSNEQKNQEHFNNCEAIYRTEFSSGTPVFVPATDQSAETKNSTAKYYSKGYWVKYMGGTGYWLIIYNEAGDKELVRREFTSETQRMTMTSIVDLEANHTYKYKVYRNDNYYYKGGDITYSTKDYIALNKGEKGSIKTTETGDYTFTMDYSKGDLQIKVTYPGEVGDYRILYTDDVRNGRYKPSQIISQNNKEPLVSFFVRPNNNPELKVQSVARVTGEGVTWATTENEIYFKPNANWKSDGARFAAYFYVDANNKWVDLKANGDLYSCAKPTDKAYTHVIFVRMDPKNATNNWNNKWNQTGHLALTTNNLYTLKEGEWGNKLYLKPNSYWFQKDGNQKDPRFAAYFFNSNTDYEWVSMGNPVDGVYSCDIPATVYKKVIFCRMNGGNETNDWSNKYNQSSDLTVPTDGKTLYTVKDNTWDNGGGSWSEREGSWSTISGSITDLSNELKSKIGELGLNLAKDTGSVFNIHLSNNEGTLTIEKVALYTGNYYIRVDAVDGKWYDYKNNPDNLMTYSAFSESDANSFGEKFSHYKTKWCEINTNVKFVIANDYSLCISDTLTQDEGNPFGNIDVHGNINNNDKYKANIRFMWNRHTNKVSRAYVARASDPKYKFLVLKANKPIQNEAGQAYSNNEVVFQDTQNWLYERTIKVQPGTLVKLYACYPDVNEAKAQHFRGKYSNDFTEDETAVQLLGGTSSEWYTMRLIYDFKTNRLMAAWVPDQNINGTLEIDADVMVIRQHQEDATCITFANDKSALTAVKTVYGVMRFNRWTLNNRSTSTHDVLPLKEQKTIYERALYFISFPFDVHLSDVFGFGTYGTHWVISEYNGKRRAQNGYFVDNCMNEDCTNWDYIWDPSNFTMKANQGYLLSLDLDLMKSDNESFWAHGINQVELFFPSFEDVKTIQKTEYTMPALDEKDYLCKHKGHEVIDSYWRCIGVPSFADYNGSLYGSEQDYQNKTPFKWNPKGSDLPYLYEWNVADNSLMVRAASTYNFRSTFAYLVQNGNPIYWSVVNAKPANIVAKQQGESTNYEWRLTLTCNEQVEDQAFVRLSNDEKITNNFDFNQDLSKEFNYGRSDIYTLIGYEKAAANSLPISEQTTVIPLGLSIEYNGDYTLAMPDRVNGIGVTLIDSETGTRTNLSAGMVYTLTLKKGDYNNRFYIEISPVQQVPTDIEYVTGDSNSQDNVRKVLIDNILYIVRDGQIFDARGARVK